MTNRNRTTAGAVERPSLTRSRNEAAKRIEERISLGNDLAQRRPTQWAEAESFRNEMQKWQEYTFDLLAMLFTSDSIAKEFRSAGFPTRAAHSEAEAYALTIDAFVGSQLPKLDSIYHRLELFDEPQQQGRFEDRSTTPSVQDNSKVFVVHGHDSTTLHAVTRFVEKLELKAVILNEQPSEGNTVIEKLHANSDVAFAVVLLTGDDVGASKSEADKLRARARQNVVLELGYFMGKLERKNVCALYETGVELPSDFHGVVYVQLDNSGGWKMTLAREMKASGLPIDMNKAI